MKLQINITKEILEQSMWCSTATSSRSRCYLYNEGVGFNCAVALAINKLLPHAWVLSDSIDIFETLDQFINDECAYKIIMPSTVAQFIKAFDDYHPTERMNMTPFSFEIDVPEELINKIGIDEVYAILWQSKTLELV